MPQNALRERPPARSRLTYANVAATTALVVAVAGGGGAAVAAAVAKNSVRSPQIKNGQVKRVDLGRNAVTGPKVVERTLAKVPSAGRADTATRAGTAGRADTAGRALNVVTAAVTVAGALDAQGNNTGAVSARRVITGSYEVVFDRDVTDCAHLVSVGQLAASAPVAFATGVRRTGNPRGIFVQTFNAAGTLTNAPFFAAVVC